MNPQRVALPRAGQSLSRGSTRKVTSAHPTDSRSEIQLRARPNDAVPGGHPQGTRLRFDRFVLDLARGCLLLNDNEIALRPKTFAVMRHLAQNSGRLVAKDELFDAVWPGLAVTDDALVQSIGELRRALGEDGARRIKTIPRRGYRFEVDVSVDGPMDQPLSEVEPVSMTRGDPGRPPAAVNRRRRRQAWLVSVSGGLRGALSGLLICMILLVAGALWVGIKADRKSPGTPRLAQAEPPIREIAGKPAIAVLPLANQSQDSAHQYFADGLTQDIINALGRFSALTVISWNGVLRYKGKPASPEAIGEALGVGYLVEGSTRQRDDRVQVIAQLVDTRQGRVLWSTRLDQALADLFALQDKITTQIAGALAIHLEDIEQRREATKPTANLEAYDYLLRARPSLLRPTRGGMAQARLLLERAIDLDPNYAAAYAALADTYYIATAMGWAESPIAYMGHAKKMADKALSLSDSEVRAHVILGRIDIFHHRYQQAKAEMDRALDINPNDAHALAGRGNVLMWSGQTDAAIKALELAQRLDPELNPLDRFALSLAYYLKGQYDAAIEEAERNLRENPGANFSRIVLAAAFAEQGRADEVAHIVPAIGQFDPTFDPEEFGTKFLNFNDLAHLREGLRKAGLYPAGARR
jgi:adenylate cyclase